MPLNARSKKLIQDSKLVLAREIKVNPKFSVAYAKSIIRRCTGVSRVMPVTLRRIAEQGKEEGLYNYDGKTFFSVNAQATPRLLRSYLDEWAATTTTESDPRVLKSRCNMALNDLGEPTTDDDVVKLAQRMNMVVDPSNMSAWNRLGSFRSFATWLINKGYMTGDVNLLWPTPEVLEPVRVGGYTARVRPQTMTNLDNQWQYTITDTSGVQRDIILAREDQIEDALRAYAKQEFEDQDEVLDLDDLFVSPVLIDDTVDGDGGTTADSEDTDNEERVIGPVLNNNNHSRTRVAAGTSPISVEVPSPERFDRSIFAEAAQEIEDQGTTADTDDEDTSGVTDDQLASLNLTSELQAAVMAMGGRDQLTMDRLTIQLEALDNDVSVLTAALGSLNNRISTIKVLLGLD